MKILVTGGAGFVGSHVTEKLLADGHEVAIIDNFSFGKESNLRPEATLHRLDLVTATDTELRTLLESINPAAIVHLAAIHFIPYCIAHPRETFDINTGVTERLLRLNQGIASRFLLASTMDVYAPVNQIHAETDTPLPCNIYGASKLLAEKLLEYTVRVCENFTGITLRFANVIGTRETNPHLIPDIITRLRDKSPPEIRMGYLGSGRDFVDARDLARAVCLALLNEPERHAIYNVGSGQNTPVRTVVELMKQLAGDPRPIIEDAQKFRKFDRETLSPDITKLSQTFNWSPNIPLRQTLEELISTSL